MTRQGFWLFWTSLSVIRPVGHFFSCPMCEVVLYWFLVMLKGLFK